MCMWRRQWQPTPVLMPGKSHGRRSLVGHSPWGCEESDTTERLHFHFSFSCIGEGNGNPLQCFCLENPRDGRAWWAAVMGSHRVRHDWSNAAAAACVWILDIPLESDRKPFLLCLPCPYPRTAEPVNRREFVWLTQLVTNLQRVDQVGNNLVFPQSSWLGFSPY